MQVLLPIPGPVAVVQGVDEDAETVEEREALLKLGCDLLQGVLLGKPSHELGVARF